MDRSQPLETRSLGATSSHRPRVVRIRPALRESPSDDFVVMRRPPASRASTTRQWVGYDLRGLPVRADFARFVARRFGDFFDVFAVARFAVGFAVVPAVAG